MGKTNKNLKQDPLMVRIPNFMVIFHKSLWNGVTLLILLLVAGSNAACNSSIPTADRPLDEIRIGVVAPLSGAYASTAGLSTKNAAELAVQQVNSAGGLQVNGRYVPVRLFIEDDAHDPELTVQVTKKLITEDQVIALVGYPSSVVAIPAAAVAEEAGVPMISSSSTHPETTQGKTFVFRVAFLDSFQGWVLAKFAREELQATRAAVLYNRDTDYSSGLAKIFQESFENIGGQVVALESYSTNAADSADSAHAHMDWTPQLAVLANHQPEVIILPNYEDKVVMQAEQIRTQGITATLIGTDAWSYIEPEDFALPALDEAYYTAHWSPDIASKTAQAFMGAYYDAYNSIPLENAALTYDAFGLLFQTIQSEQQATPQAIRDGLHSVDIYSGVTGTIEYSEETGDPIRSVVILQIIGEQPVFSLQINP
jgi:branched-chain amino acid transport system substrate-binding protein